ncbi:MAG TPA: hypothetical protein VK633_11630, partial [Verrucomicrobiae bacterium]|nr:hypothetical protein [Verrucomicrobiae bacterium]
EPLIDIAPGGTNLVRLTLYAKPGTQLLLQETSDLRPPAFWNDATGLTMSSTFHSSLWVMETNRPVFFRLERNN